MRRSPPRATPPEPRSNVSLLSTENAIRAGYSARIDFVRGIESGTINAFASLLSRSALFHVAQLDITDVCFGTVAHEDEVVPVAHVLINGSEIWIACLIYAVRGRCLKVELLVG